MTKSFYIQQDITFKDPILPSRPVQPHTWTICSTFRISCFEPLPRPATSLQVRCFACQNVLSHAFYPGQIPLWSHFSVGSGQSTPSSGHKSSRQSGSSAGPQQRKGRKIGTQEPLETGYCDILGVPVNPMTDRIK